MILLVSITFVEVEIYEDEGEHLFFVTLESKQTVIEISISSKHHFQDKDTLLFDWLLKRRNEKIEENNFLNESRLFYGLIIARTKKTHFYKRK